MASSMLFACSQLCLESADELVFNRIVFMDDLIEEAVHDATFLSYDPKWYCLWFINFWFGLSWKDWMDSIAVS